MGETLQQQIESRNSHPRHPVPVFQLTSRDFDTPPRSGLRATWFGHASALIEIDGYRVLIDPVWSDRVSPSQWFGPRRFHRVAIPLDELPPLDAIIISHDHYDHLDMATVRNLARASSQARARFIVPLGVGAHLERWGIAPARIMEVNWGDSISLGALTIHVHPARHFSGRLFRRNQTLWAAWSLVGPQHRVFLSGDTGPLGEFSKVGREHGPFDLALVAIGAYSTSWPSIHINPEQALEVSEQVCSKVLLPIHWGTFKLAFHPWNEPIERLVAAAKQRHAQVATPVPGQPIEPSSLPPFDPWWREVDAP